MQNEYKLGQKILSVGTIFTIDFNPLSSIVSCLTKAEWSPHPLQHTERLIHTPLSQEEKIILWEDGRGNLEEVGDSVDPLPVDDGGNTIPAGEDVWLWPHTMLHMYELESTS